MTVLAIIGLIIAVGVLYAITLKIKSVAIGRYGFDGLFDSTSVFIGIGYILLFFGNSTYHDAFVSHGDTLNGILLIAIGLIIIGFKLYYNISSMKYSLLGVIFTVYELILFIPITIIAVFVFVCAVAYFSDTKPVWVVND